VHADPDRLAQVITNLLSNAIKFSPPDGEVEIAVQKHEDQVRISVRDHGPEFRLTFGRTCSKNSRRPTHGCGTQGRHRSRLSIVKQIVTRLGGNVGFDDAHGEAPCFTWIWRPGPGDRKGDRSRPEPERSPNIAVRRRSQSGDCDPRGSQATRICHDLAHTRADAIARAAATPYGAILVDFDLLDGEGTG